VVPISFVLAVGSSDVAWCTTSVWTTRDGCEFGMSWMVHELGPAAADRCLCFSVVRVSASAIRVAIQTVVETALDESNQDDVDGAPRRFEAPDLRSSRFNAGWMQVECPTPRHYGANAYPSFASMYASSSPCPHLSLPPSPSVHPY
jgi:hypothetical protein